MRWRDRGPNQWSCSECGTFVSRPPPGKWPSWANGPDDPLWLAVPNPAEGCACPMCSCEGEETIVDGPLGTAKPP